jgi:hypothetical protein
MAVDFQRQRATFPSHTGSAQSIELAFGFPTAVRKADAAINGFSIGYAGSDHHLLRADIDTEARIDPAHPDLVRVTVRFALRDSSGTFDDPYNGFVDVLAIVDRA